MNIILASASPRRKELLGYIYEKFECIPANIDETIPDEIETEYSAEYLASIKAEYIAKNHPEDLVIGCDTIVVYNGKIFGKPESEEEAYNMLSLLSGNIHKVITGVCIYINGQKYSFSDITNVEFYKFSDDEIRDYIKTGSPMDKAGAYGIQDGSLLPAKSITGDYFNVVGLPIGRLKRELKKINF